jgi:hypothetical protein
VVEYVRHLEAELESAKNCEIDENGHFVRDLSVAEPHADEKGHIVFPDDKAGADPWTEAKGRIESERLKWMGKYRSPVVAYVDHLEAENSAKAARISELEAEQGTFPPLDPKRVIATACRILAENSEMYAAAWIMQTFKAGDAGIYPLAVDET